MNKFTYEDIPASLSTRGNNPFFIRGLNENGVNKYLTAKDSMAYKFLQKQTFDSLAFKKTNDLTNGSGKGFFPTAIDYRTARNADIGMSENEFEEKRKHATEIGFNNVTNINANMSNFNRAGSIGSKNKLPIIPIESQIGSNAKNNRNEIYTKRKFDPLLTKQKLIMMSRSYSVANLDIHKIHVKSCKAIPPKFPYQTRHDTEKYNNNYLYNIKRNIFANNRSCDNFRPRLGSFDVSHVPRVNSNEKRMDSKITTIYYDKIQNSVKGPKHRVNKTEIKFDLQGVFDREKEKTQRIIFNNTNNNYLAKFKLPKLSLISSQPKITYSKSPNNSKMMGEKYNPYNSEAVKRNMVVRNYHGALYPH